MGLSLIARVQGAPAVRHVYGTEPSGACSGWPVSIARRYQRQAGGAQPQADDDLVRAAVWGPCCQMFGEHPSDTLRRPAS
jgi:hypothetical protein